MNRLAQIVSSQLVLATFAGAVIFILQLLFPVLACIQIDLAQWILPLEFHGGNFLPRVSSPPMAILCLRLMPLVGLPIAFKRSALPDIFTIHEMLPLSQLPLYLRLFEIGLRLFINVHITL